MVNVSSNQREFLRIPATYRVKVVAPNQIIELTRVMNISLGGILIGGPERLPVGSSCGVAILLDNAEAGKRIVTRGTVVRSDGDGMAIAFSRDLDADSLEALRILIGSAFPGVDGAFEARIKDCG